MRKALIILCFLFSLGCNQSKTEEKSGGIVKENNSTSKNAKNRVFIKDESEYSSNFIKEVSSPDFQDSVKLINNYYIVGNDTTLFPNDLELNKEYLFTAIKVNQVYKLNARRINFTTVNFDFRLFKNDSLIFNEKGEADLRSTFYLAAEGDDDNETGDAYGSYEYVMQENDCWFNVRIGIGKDLNGKQRAKLDYGCEDILKVSIDLNDSPVLRTI